MKKIEGYLCYSGLGYPYPPGKCALCKKPLSRYNPYKICNSCKGKNPADETLPLRQQGERKKKPVQGAVLSQQRLAPLQLLRPFAVKPQTVFFIVSNHSEIPAKTAVW